MPLSASAFDGSAIKTSFSVTSTTQLRFDWALGQHIAGAGGNDVAYAVLDGALFVLTDATSARFTKTQNDFKFTDYQTSLSLPSVAAGAHTLALGIVNIATGSGRTLLLIDNLILSSLAGAPAPSPGHTPEPLTAALAATSLTALALQVRRRRHTLIADA